MVCHGGFANCTCIELSQEQLASIALVGGSAPLYSAFVTSSDKAFALFLLHYYRNPPLAKETKITKKQDDDDDQEEDKQQGKEGDNKDNKKQIYKKKIDVHWGEKDYKKWMTAINEMKKRKRKTRCRQGR